VVGGTGGIGGAVARSLALRGADIFLLGTRDGGRMAAALASLRGLGVQAEGLPMDLERESRFDFVAMLGPEPRFDILIAAFGPFLRKPLASTSTADWLDIARLDLALPGALASFVLPGMVERKWGRIVFFGGTGTDTIRGYSTNSAYAAAKTGLGVLAKSVAIQHASDGIGAFVACPGLVDTEYLDSATRRALAAKSPGGMLIQTDAIGETVATLAAADPCLASGSIVAMDGGLSFAKA